MRAIWVMAGLMSLMGGFAQAQTVTRLDDNRHVPYYDTALPVYTAGRVRFSKISPDPRPDGCPAPKPAPAPASKTGKGRHAVPDIVAVMPCMPPTDYVPPPMYPVFAYGWPGVYFESRFSGDEVLVRLDDATSDLELLIDGEPIQRFSKPGLAIYDVTGLKPGDHTVRLERLNEDLQTGGAFGGFYIPVGSEFLMRTSPPPAPHTAGKALPPQKRERRIEFIGDSYLSGYGTTSTKRTCTPEEIHATTDTQLAWGSLIARHYDADYQINAVSGIGMVRNYGGSPGAVMPDRYGRDLMGVPVDIHSYQTVTASVSTEGAALRPYGVLDDRSPDNWQPQIIVIALGDNDFATPLTPAEHWADMAALRGDFTMTYLAFLKTLRARNPKATFVLVDYGEPELIPDLVAIAAIAKVRGDDRILTWSTGTSFEQTGCDWHLSVNDHKRIAADLEAFIDAHPGLWE